MINGVHDIDPGGDPCKFQSGVCAPVHDLTCVTFYVRRIYDHSFPEFRLIRSVGMLELDYYSIITGPARCNEGVAESSFASSMKVLYRSGSVSLKPLPSHSPWYSLSLMMTVLGLSSLLVTLGLWVLAFWAYESLAVGVIWATCKPHLLGCWEWPSGSVPLYG